MYIKQLKVNNLRILVETCFSPGPAINLITGDNGAGKTSILEAIYLLGRGRSFRHRESGPFIRNGNSQCLVLAELQNDDGSDSRLGVERASTSIRVRKDGVEVHKRSRLLQALPLQIITPKSHELIEKGPETRRNFLDYGMFHVEHDYLGHLSDYNRALKQRNAALRLSQHDVAKSYIPMLSSLAEVIQVYRQSYLRLLQEYLVETLGTLSVTFPVNLTLSPGWDTDKTLENVLLAKEATDFKRGFTSAGIHRADLVVQSGGALASHRLSRGQQKVLVYALKIAQTNLLMRSKSQRPILLVDDLTAELDKNHLLNMVKLFEKMGVQVFISAVSSATLPVGINTQVFHVEHGEISSV